MRNTRLTCETLSVLPAHTLTSYQGYITYSDAILHVCLDFGMSAEYKLPRGSKSLLDKHIYRRRVKTAALLIRYGADVNAYDGFFLRCAAYDNDTDMVSMCIKAGANVNLYGMDRRTAISSALTHASYSVVLQLLQAGSGIPTDALTLAQNTHIDRDLKVECIITSLRQKS